VLQHESTALRAACARTAAGCAAGAAAGCPGLSCRAGPCCGPGAVCRGRDSAACQAQHAACPGRCPGRGGETCGGKEPPAGQGPSDATAAAWGRGLTATLHPRVFPRALCKWRDKAGIFPSLLIGKRRGGRILKVLKASLRFLNCTFFHLLFCELSHRMCVQPLLSERMEPADIIIAFCHHE